MKEKIFLCIYNYLIRKFPRLKNIQVQPSMALDYHGLGLDSLEIISLIFDLEEMFQIELDAENYYEIKKIEQLIEHIEKKLKENSFCKQFELFENQIAIIDGTETIRYKELTHRVRNVTEELCRLGIQKGDGVLFTLENCWEYIVLFLAVLECDGVPILADYTAEKEWEKMAEESKARFMLCRQNKEKYTQAKICGKVLGIQLIRFDDVGEKNIVLKSAALIHYTSGSTGKPNGVVHDISSLRNMSSRFRQAFGFTGKEVLLAVLPFSHGYGLSCVLLSGLSAGSCLVVMSRFDPIKAVQLMRKYAVTHLFAVPPMLELLCRAVQRSGPLTTLSYCCSSSLKLSNDLAEKFWKITGVVVNQEYGSAETGVISFSNNSEPLKDISCVGKLLYPEGTVINKSGELLLVSPEMAIGYSDGSQFDIPWNTHDLVELKDNQLYLKGRTKNLLNCGGRKVFAEEVSLALLQTGLFEDVYVCGGDDETYIRAFVVAKTEKLYTRIELVNILERQMDPYKIPAEFFYVPKILKNELGKVTQKCIWEMQTCATTL